MNFKFRAENICLHFPESRCHFSQIRRVYTDFVQPRRNGQDVIPAKSKRTLKPAKLRATEEEPLVTLDFQGYKAEYNLPKVSVDPVVQSESSRKVKTAKEARDTHKPGLSREKTRQLIERLVNNRPRKCKSLEVIRKRKQVTTRLHRSLQSFHADYDDRIASLDESLISTKIFYYLKDFDIYARLLFGQVKEATSAMEGAATAGTSSSTSSAPTAKRARLDDEALSARRTHEMNRKLLKAQRMYDNNRMLLQPERLEVVKERDSLFAWNYMHKVRDTYLAEGRPEKVDEFLRILKNVKATDSVPVLYQVRKLENSNKIQFCYNFKASLIKL